MEKKYHEEEWLREKYYQEDLSTKEIGIMVGVTETTIYRWLCKNNIEIKEEHYPYHDKKWLQREYHEKDKSAEKIAEECNVTFSVIHKWIRKHDIEHKSANTNKKHTIICKNCGKEFETLKSDTDRKYCSRKCAAEGRKKEKVTLTCKNCGEKFEKLPSQIFHDGPYYCSKECYSEAHHHKEVCQQCGKEFEVKDSVKGQKFCSYECASKFRAETYGDDSSYSTYEAKRNNAPGDWERNIKLAKERDNHACAICGADKQIQVHHIKPLRFGGTNYIGNLITVCPKCHGRIEGDVTKRLTPETKESSKGNKDGKQRSRNDYNGETPLVIKDKEGNVLESI